MKKKLDELIPEYFKTKSKMDTLKKDVDELNKEIKDKMDIGDVYEIDNYTAKLTKQERVTFDEAKMVEIVKHSCYKNPNSRKEVYNISLESYPGLLVTKQCINFDVLEELIYNNKLSPETLAQLNQCKHETITKVLKVTKK